MRCRVANDHDHDDHTAQPVEEFEPDHRFTMANERTFLAWQRTALGLLAAAVAVVQLVPELSVPALRLIVGGVLAALAFLTAVAGLRRWNRVDEAMRRGQPLPRHRAPVWLGVGLAFVTVLCVALIASRAV